MLPLHTSHNKAKRKEYHKTCGGVYFASDARKIKSRQWQVCSEYTLTRLSKFGPKSINTLPTGLVQKIHINCSYFSAKFKLFLQITWLFKCFNLFLFVLFFSVLLAFRDRWRGLHKDPWHILKPPWKYSLKPETIRWTVKKKKTCSWKNFYMYTL